MGTSLSWGTTVDRDRSSPLFSCPGTQPPSLGGFGFGFAPFHHRRRALWLLLCRFSSIDPTCRVYLSFCQNLSSASALSPTRSRLSVNMYTDIDPILWVLARVRSSHVPFSVLSYCFPSPLYRFFFPPCLRGIVYVKQPKRGFLPVAVVAL